MIMHNVAQLPVVKYKIFKQSYSVITRRDIVEAHDRTILFVPGEEAKKLKFATLSRLYSLQPARKLYA